MLCETGWLKGDTTYLVQVLLQRAVVLYPVQ